MRADDETTAVQLHELLKPKGYNVSLHTAMSYLVGVDVSRKLLLPAFETSSS